jgi:hypothetical protein
MKSKSYEKEVNTPDELLAPIFDAAACITKREGHLDGQSPIFAQELQSSLWWTVGFTDIYSEQQQVFSFLCNKCVIET